MKETPPPRAWLAQGWKRCRRRLLGPLHPVRGDGCGLTPAATRVAAVVALLAALGHPLAQPIITAPPPTSPGQPDPLSAFMVPQPPIDTTSPIEAQAGFEPNVVPEGESAVYRVVLNVMQQSIQWPQSLPETPGLNVRRGASDQFLQNIGGTIVPRTTFLYHVTAASNGTYTLPSYEVKARDEVVRIPPATLRVVRPGSEATETPMRLQLRTRGTEFFVGQEIELEIALSGKTDGTVRTLSQVEVLGEGLIVDRDFRRQRVETRAVDGVSHPVFVNETLLTPMRPGLVEVTAYGHTVTGRTANRVIPSGGVVVRQSTVPTYTLVDSEPLTLRILPLPRELELPGFTGAIGTFAVDPPTLSTNHVTAGDLMILTVTVRGKGNLQRVLPPSVEADSRWQVVEPQKPNAMAAVIRQRGFTSFDYRLIPLSDAVRETPAIPFCYFDPVLRHYVDLTVDPIPITVDPAAPGTSAEARLSVPEARSFLHALIEKPDVPTALADGLGARGRAVRRINPLYRPFGFLAAQLLPAIALGGIWYWDRRRRFFEVHPQELLRRRARKAVARAARRARAAARRADAKQFLHYALHGIREACAPAAPANPRALVRKDVLETLPPALRRDRTVAIVDRLFSAANQWQFGDTPPAPADLLALAQDVDHELKAMRELL